MLLCFEIDFGWKLQMNAILTSYIAAAFIPSGRKAPHHGVIQRTEEEPQKEGVEEINIILS